MRFYATQYDVIDQSDPSRSVTFSSMIYAKSYAHACKLAVMRNIGEMVVGVRKTSQYDPCPLPSYFYKNRQMIDCLHTLTFYAWIASMSKVVDLRSLCNDLGILHEIMHEMHHPHVYSFRQNIFDRLSSLERSIPGLKTYELMEETL